MNAWRDLALQIEVLRRWPFPVGYMADELVRLLILEEKCPGNAFRFRLRDEIPLIDVLAGEKVIQSEKAKWNMSSLGQT